MADVDTTHTFLDGDTVHGADMNNIQDQSTLQTAAIFGKPTVTPDPAADYVLIYDATGPQLAKSRIDSIPGVASVAFTSNMPGTTVINGTPTGPAVSIILNNNIAHLPGQFLGSPDGVSGVSAYRSLASRDMAISQHIITAWDIDWSVSNNFYKAVSASGTFTFNSGGPGLAVDGQTIIVLVGQLAGAKTVTWPTVRWDNGVVPVLTATPGKSDLYQFWYLGGSVFGKRILQNA